MKRILLVAPSDLPIPSVKGGAVETGIQQIIDENENHKNIKIDIYSFFDEKAYEKSKQYKNTSFYFYVPPKGEQLLNTTLRGLNAICRKGHIRIALNTRPLFTRYVCKQIKNNQYDAILIKNAIRYIIPISKSSNSKLFLQLHNDFLNAEVPKAKKIASKCTKIIANSNYIKTRIMTIDGIASNDVVINMNCLDKSSFDKGNSTYKRNLIKQYGLDEKTKIILFSGRLVKEKGIDKLIEAMQRIGTEKKWVLLVAGAKWFSTSKPDKFSQTLERQAAGLKKRIIFLGYVPHSEISHLNSIADVVVIPSMWEEPAGRVALEAAATGTPIIISDAGGLVEYANPKTSIIIKRDERFVENLSKAIFDILFAGKKSYSSVEAISFARQFSSERYYTEIMRYLGAA